MIEIRKYTLLQMTTKEMTQQYIPHPVMKGKLNGDKRVQLGRDKIGMMREFNFKKVNFSCDYHPTQLGT